MDEPPRNEEEYREKLIKSADRKVRDGKSKAKGMGKLDTKSERIARAICNPANFAELILGMNLYPKQREALEACQVPGSMVSVAAANGSGKTSRILPALVLWHQYLFPAGKVKCTSGAFQQIRDQVWPAIMLYKEKFPRWKWLETPRFESYDEDIKRKGFFVGFTTDEPGKAEGDHPDGPDVPLLFIVDECKTAPVWLRGVIEGRVRPTRLVLMSSHGFAEGWFYESQRSPMLKDKFKRFTISAYDCPHISQEEIEQVKKDFSGQPDFYNSVLGIDFIPLVEDACINGRALDDCLANPPDRKEKGEVHAFCDFAWSGSGNENVLALRRGNIISIEKTFQCGHLKSSVRHPDAGIVEQFVAEFVRLGLEPGQISGDEGGGGALVMDALEEAGWILNRVNNGSPSTNPDRYVNFAAEMWFEAGKHITNKTFVFPDDRVFRAQALSRKRIYSPKQKLAVESKDDMKKRGVASPDRADAVFGCCMPSGGYSAGILSWAIPVQSGRYEAMGS